MYALRILFALSTLSSPALACDFDVERIDRETVGIFTGRVAAFDQDDGGLPVDPNFPRFVVTVDVDDVTRGDFQRGEAVTFAARASYDILDYMDGCPMPVFTFEVGDQVEVAIRIYEDGYYARRLVEERAVE